jgi:hypothetical protein
MTILSAAGCCVRLDEQQSPLRTYHGLFLRAEKPSEDISWRLFFAEHERVKDRVIFMEFCFCKDLELISSAVIRFRIDNIANAFRSSF